MRVIIHIDTDGEAGAHRCWLVGVESCRESAWNGVPCTVHGGVCTGESHNKERRRWV